MPREPDRKKLWSKPHPRVIAFDDAPFTFESESTPVVGVSVSLPSYVEGVLRGDVTIDGDDSALVISAMMKGSPHMTAAKAIMLDGIALGGFNVVDLDALHESTRLPIVTVTRRKPDISAMEAALRKHLPGRTDLVRLLHLHPLFPYPARPRQLWVSSVGASPEDAVSLIEKSIVRGSFPEPLRLAHLFASAIPRGPVSRSRA